MKNVTVALLAILALSGCSQRVADLTVASTKNMNLNSDGFVTGERVEGEDMVPVVLFPFGIPQVKEATDKAIENNHCAVGLTDVVVTQKNHAFLFLLGAIGFSVEGNLVIDANKPGCEQYLNKA